METFKKISRLWLPFTKASAGHHAAGVCFHLLSSAIPTSLLVLALGAPVPPLHRHLPGASTIVPPSIASLLEQIVGYIGARRSISLISIAGLAALWSSSRVILALRRGIHAMEDLPFHGGYLHRRLRAMGALLLLFGVLWLLSLMAGSVLSLLGRYVYSLLILFFFLLFLYRLLSDRKRPLLYDAAGAGFAALVWMSSTGLFSIYVNYISHYDRDYGFVGILFLSLLWLKLCIQVLFYGIRLSHLLYDGKYSPVQILRSIFSR